MTVLELGFEAMVAAAVEYTATPFSINAASSKINIDTADIPRAAFSPDDLATTLHPLNNSNSDFESFTNMLRLFASSFGFAE